MRETANGIFILVNGKPYKTEIQYLTKEGYETLPELVLGCKVKFDDTTVTLAEFSDCPRCHISIPLGEVTNEF
tara:strand:- start:561 stop:779 length:219 start_codon:yes stop_codon:yes gene_type:complete